MLPLWSNHGCYHETPESCLACQPHLTMILCQLLRSFCAQYFECVFCYGICKILFTQTTSCVHFLFPLFVNYCITRTVIAKHVHKELGGSEISNVVSGRYFLLWSSTFINGGLSFLTPSLASSMYTSLIPFISALLIKLELSCASVLFFLTTASLTIISPRERVLWLNDWSSQLLQVLAARLLFCYWR